MPTYALWFESINKARLPLDSKVVTGLMICGDFNLPEILWDEEFIAFTKVKAYESIEHTMIESLKDNFLHQNVNFPT